VATVRPRWASKRLDCRLWKLESAFSTWDIFYQHHDNKDKSNIFKTSGQRGLFWVCFWDLTLALFLAEVGPPLYGLCMERGKIAKLPDDSSSWLRIICSPQVFDKAAILHFASSNKMMLAANSANQGDNKVARSGRRI
jgi:hypothetical protein